MNKVFLVVQGRNRRYISVRQSKCHRQGTGGPAACHGSFGQEGASVDGLDAGEEAGMPSCLGIEGSTDTRSFQAQGVFKLCSETSGCVDAFSHGPSKGLTGIRPHQIFGT